MFKCRCLYFTPWKDNTTALWIHQTLHITKLSLTAGIGKGNISNLHTLPPPPSSLQPPTSDCQRIIHLSSALRQDFQLLSPAALWPAYLCRWISASPLPKRFFPAGKQVVLHLFRGQEKVVFIIPCWPDLWPTLTPQSLHIWFRSLWIAANNSAKQARGATDRPYQCDRNQRK